MERLGPDLRAKDSDATSGSVVGHDHDEGFLGGAALERDKMLLLLREFPLALERYLAEHDNLLPSIKPIVPIREIATNGVGGGGDERNAYASTRETDSNIFCIVPGMGEGKDDAGGGQFWSSLFGGIFCFMDDGYRYDDDENDNNDPSRNWNPGDDNDGQANGTSTSASRMSKNRRKRANSNGKRGTGSDNMPNGENKAQKCKEALQMKVPSDWQMNKVGFASEIISEARRIFSLYMGLTRFDGLVFNWSLKATKKGVTVHTSPVPDSDWLAVKSDVILKADKWDIFNLIIDDSKAHLYEEQIEGYEVLDILDDASKIRRYWYKAVWPTAPRDFVMMTTWKELENGHIMICTVSPPEGYCPKVSGYTRGTIMSSGAYIRPIDPRSGGGCALTFITHADIGGSVSSTLLNMFIVGTPVKTMTEIKKVLTNQGAIKK